MRKEWLIIPIVCVVTAVAVSPARAEIKRKHRPWMLITRTSSPKASVEDPSLPLKADAMDSRQQHAGATDGKMSTSVVRAKSSENEKGEKVVDQALRYKGTRYRFGGSSKRGLDCSGLVNRVWQDLQMNKIPRASASLYRSGTPVKLSQLQPGDLVFFKNTYKRGVSHVGVYAGKNKFVHASSRKGVTITALSDPYYQLRYAGARRLF